MFGGIKLGDVVGGLAKSLDERLKDDMRRTDERSDRIKEFHVRRGIEKQERFEKEQKDLEENLRQLAGLMKTSDIEIPDGMTEADFAAQLYSGAGGTLSAGKQLYADLMEHQKMGGSVKKLLGESTKFQAAGKGFGDYVNNFVRRPENILKPMGSVIQGTGFLKDAKIDTGVSAEMTAMFGEEKQADRFDVSGIGIDPMQLKTVEAYKKKDQLIDLQI